MRVSRKTVLHAEAENSDPPHFPIFRVYMAGLSAFPTSLCLVTPSAKSRPGLVLVKDCRWRGLRLAKFNRQGVDGIASTDAHHAEDNPTSRLIANSKLRSQTEQFGLVPNRRCSAPG